MDRWAQCISICIPATASSFMRRTLRFDAVGFEMTAAAMAMTTQVTVVTNPMIIINSPSWRWCATFPHRRRPPPRKRHSPTRKSRRSITNSATVSIPSSRGHPSNTCPERARPWTSSRLPATCSKPSAAIPNSYLPRWHGITSRDCPCRNAAPNTWHCPTPTSAAWRCRRKSSIRDSIRPCSGRNRAARPSRAGRAPRRCGNGCTRGPACRSRGGRIGTVGLGIWSPTERGIMDTCTRRRLRPTFGEAYCRNACRRLRRRLWRR
mmetsp:Transcript_9608/g.16773  ORF Transcript_9608/g.16773 Transcript_9608/m.16773 type:complete len:264 (-) Transcript_9608:239-1030(-)